MEPESTIAYRLNTLEQNVASLKQQLENYVPLRENNLQLSSIRETVERIERDVQSAKSQISDVNTKIIAQRESQATLQIKVLVGILSTVVFVLTSVLIGYLTHLLH